MNTIRLIKTKWKGKLKYAQCAAWVVVSRIVANHQLLRLNLEDIFQVLF